MRPFQLVRGTVVAVVLALAGSCTVRHAGSLETPISRAAADLPDHFVVSTSKGPVEPSPGEGCRNPLLDPRDGTLLVLVRSAEGRGDYEAPPPRYGLGERELVRVECATGRALGVVKR